MERKGSYGEAGIESITRRTFLRRVGGWLAGAMILGGGLAGYAKYQEPYHPIIQNICLEHPSLPQPFDGFKLVQLSDIHIGNGLGWDHFAQIVQRVNALEADLIIFTGDLLDGNPLEVEGISNHFSRLQSRDGVLAVLGNHDYWAGRRGAELIREQLQQGGVRVLHNTHHTLERAGTYITFAGVDDVLLGEPDLGQALQGIPPQRFTSLLVHEPDYAQVAKEYPLQYQFSGHSHGGQIRFPFVGALYYPPLGREFPEGLQSVANSQLQVYTNRGLGMTGPQYRFRCPPEITQFIFSAPSKLSIC